MKERNCILPGVKYSRFRRDASFPFAFPPDSFLKNDRDLY
jgi:hypothetical protein